MSKPAFTFWGNPGNTIAPDAGKFTEGWKAGEKPPNQWANYLQNQCALADDYLYNKVQNVEPVLMRSNTSLNWDGADITFLNDIELHFKTKKAGAAQINKINSADSPLSLSDGDVLIVKRDYAGSSPLNLSTGTYGSLAAGQYVVVSEASLTLGDEENEMILFRRRGANLEIPYLGKVVRADTDFYLGLSSAVDSYIEDVGNFYTGESVEAALQEIASSIVSGGSVVASAVAITDAGNYYAGSEVESSLQAIGASLAAQPASLNALVPIGTIIAFYNYNGALTFDSTKWAYCNGTTKTFAGIGPQATPDLSNRYLVGFGTEGGGDNDTAAWATAAVGNINHIVNVQHFHAVQSHNHSVTSHSHSIAALVVAAHTHDLGFHAHGVGNQQFQVGELIITGTGGDPRYNMYNAGGTAVQLSFDSGDATAGASGNGKLQVSANTAQNFYTKNGTGSTAAASGSTGSAGSTTSAGSTGSASPVTTSATPFTDQQLSSSQSFQPRSVRVRYLIRFN